MNTKLYLFSLLFCASLFPMQRQKQSVRSQVTAIEQAINSSKKPIASPTNASKKTYTKSGPISPGEWNRFFNSVRK